MPDILKQVFCI